MAGLDDYLRQMTGGIRPRFELEFPHTVFEHFATGGWPTPSTSKAVIPAMVTPLEPAPEPESASVVMLRTLLAERRTLHGRAKAARDSRIAQAEEAEKRAKDLRERAAADETTMDRADAEIATVLADIEKLGGKPETSEG